MDVSILVVDDDAKMLEILRVFFQQHGYRVRTAADGGEALRLLEVEPAEVLFVDLHMPGMDGLDLCRAVRSRLPGARIYALTGYHRLFTADSANQAGFDAFLLKPADLQQLLALVRGEIDPAHLTT